METNTTKKHQQRLLATLLNSRVSGRKSLAVLLDPDQVGQNSFLALLKHADVTTIDYFFVGGSLVTDYTHREVVDTVRQHVDTPTILFPGNSLHIEPSADGILLLSLISGRNAEFLIGQHVISAPILKRSGLEILPTGYMLVDSGAQTTVSYISGTTPLPNNKPSVAACTAMAGEMLGLKLMYLDAGSGARCPVSPDIIAAVRQAVDTPILVGGGIDTPEKAHAALDAGADVIVVGNHLERNPDFLADLSAVLQSFNQPILHVL